MTRIDEIVQRPTNYLSETGVPWLMSGLVFSFLGGAQLLQHLLPLEYKLIAQWVAIGCAAGVFWGGWRVKQQIIFPRGGYVEPAERDWETRSWAYTGLTLALIGTLYFVLRILTKEEWAQLSGPVFAICFAAICVVTGRQMKWPQMYWFAGYFLCLGALLLWIHLALLSMAALECGAGAPIAAIGAFRLWKFLKTHPRVEQGGE